MSRWKGSLKSLEKTLTLSAQITQYINQDILTLNPSCLESF